MHDLAWKIPFFWGGGKVALPPCNPRQDPVDASGKRSVCSLHSQLFDPLMLKIFLNLCIAYIQWLWELSVVVKMLRLNSEWCGCDDHREHLEHAWKVGRTLLLDNFPGIMQNIIIIIIIIRLRSRRLQDVSMHIDLGQVWRSGQPTYHLHHTPTNVWCKIGRRYWTSRSPFGMWWYIESIYSDRLFFRETKDMPKKTQRSLPCTVYKWLGVSHGIYDGVRYMVSPFNIEHNPVGWCGKSIDFAFHVLW